MWALRAAGLLCLLLAAAGGPCPQPVLPPDAVLSTVGENVTLPCLQWQLEPNGTISWKLESQAVSSERAVPGASLLLRQVQYNDSGRYSCYVGSCLVRSLRLLVEEPPEPPGFSCYRRSHVRDVLCEWQPQRRPSPRTRAVLRVKKWFTGENATEQRCRYFPKVDKFTCRVTVPPSEDDTFLLVSVCVSNGVGSVASKGQVISANRVLKPDPPVNVLVDPVERAPQKLRVNWMYPPSWDSRFYRLHFQVRYRAERSQSYTEIDQLRETFLVIHDAWHGARHMVQVRGLEEFGHGSWSEWSQEAMGTPWADPNSLEWQTGSYSSQFPSDYDFYSDTFTGPPGPYSSNTEGANGEALGVGDHSTVPLHTFLVTGGSLLLGTSLLAGIVLRYKKKWRRGLLGQGKASVVVQHPLVLLAPLSPTSPVSEAPLLSPPASPSSVGSTGPFEVTNMDYLLVPQ
ncbi:interleukin-6 receptor subunit alpha [Dermochelys coriacea]|uniref:interleukin-6 receptor subunit alpha n=1 Tax=Dermochelys coriacea TaxID=27794 RepID=UPI0018E88421|nr:interleukin-6 receptor subunit alpha [Dermochelys coriacea]